jgi:GNAT superfamily N-acetyltransferase
VIEYRKLELETNKLDDIINLYNDAGWTNYTKNIDHLIQGLNNSLETIGAYHQNKLVGLIRIIGDSYTIIYIQDILVLKTYQNQGIGTNLLEMILSKYKQVRQIILLADNKENLVNFYQKSNMVDCNKIGLICFAKHNNE